MSALATARALDELRRGAPLLLAGGGSSIAVLAIELASEQGLVALETAATTAADLLLSASRAETLRLTNRLAAAGEKAVLVRRERWMDLATALATADPVLDLATPLKGPFRTVRLDDAEQRLADAAVSLAKAAELLPALLAVRNPSAPGADWLAIGLDEVSLPLPAAELRLIARVPLPIDAAEACELVAFRAASGGPEHLALVIGSPPTDRPPLVRLHSACLTGDLLGSMRCDCGPQLQSAVREIAAAGGGLLLYLQQEGRGIGLVNKLRAYALQDQGYDTIDANIRLGFTADEREFSLAARMLTLLGRNCVRLLTNNPGKVHGLEAAGVTVAERVPHRMEPGTHNRAYLETKRTRAGHLL